MYVERVFYQNQYIRVHFLSTLLYLYLREVFIEWGLSLSGNHCVTYNLVVNVQCWKDF
jgi:hypothetical protein